MTAVGAGWPVVVLGVVVVAACGPLAGGPLAIVSWRAVSWRFVSWPGSQFVYSMTVCGVIGSYQKGAPL